MLAFAGVSVSVEPVPEVPVDKVGRRGHPWLTLVSVALGVIMVGLDGSVVSIANPVIAEDLGASLAQLQWITNAYLLTLGVAVLAESRSGAEQHPDLPGIALLAAGLFALVYGLIKAQEWGWGATDTLAFLAAGIFLTLYLQNVHGYSPVQAGVRLLLPLSITMMFASPLGGVLTERFGPRLPLALGLALVGVALLLMTGLGADSGFGALWPPMAMVGLGLGFVITASAEAIVGNAPVDDAGVASGPQAPLQGVPA